jgi:hypothetical protein
MTIERIQQLIDSEIKPRSESSICDLEAADFDQFLEQHAGDVIDGRFSYGDKSLFGRLFDNAMTELQCDNRGKINSLLFTLLLGENTTLKCGNFIEIMPLLDKLPNDLDVNWGIISDPSLSQDDIKLLVIAAFDNPQS